MEVTKTWFTYDFKDVGEVIAGKQVLVKFYAKEGIPKIKSLAASCGCSKPTYDKKSEEIKILYKPNPIPTHLLSQGYYTTKKTVTVVFESGEVNKLVFKSKVV